ncbi:MAG: NAD-dependent epimerase/dehydratase family protein [Candidatus Berkelbacteria bacterium]
MAKFIVTGGAGFIGSNIVDELIKLGHKVKVIDNLSTGFEKNLEQVKDQIEFAQGDIQDLLFLENEFAGFDYCLHLAAFVSVPGSMAQPEIARNININGTKNVLEAALKNKFKHIVFSSSSAVYGESQTGINREDDILSPSSVYGETKLIGEKLCQEFAEKGLRATSLRYFNVFGPRQNPSSDYSAVIPKFISTMLKNESPTIFGDGEQSRDFIYIQNVVEANILAALNAPGQGEAINVACGASTTLNELAALINEELGTKIESKYEAARVGDIKFSQADITKLQNTIGYTPKINFKAGLKETIKWYKNQII